MLCYYHYLSFEKQVPTNISLIVASTLWYKSKTGLKNLYEKKSNPCNWLKKIFQNLNRNVREKLKN